MFETIEPESLIKLFNIDSKKELKRYCQDTIIHSKDFVVLILAAQTGTLSPYKYASHFQDRVPEHLTPRQEEIEALGQAKKGPLEGSVRKCTRRMFQFFVERRYLAAHLFYTPSGEYWHLFYFDQRDQSSRKNHWKGGSHIHFINDLWPNLTLDKIWNKVQNRDTDFSSMHIRYLDAAGENGA